MNSAFVAVAVGPNGNVWEGTCSLMTGQDAHEKARKVCERELWEQLTGHMLCGGPPYNFRENLRESGFHIHVMAVELPQTSVSGGSEE